ncbi:metallophosphoesterase [uncultured Methylobacterium sp.]|uniref:metallophosphoesterase n=1 Tax=uncultured Methylobacterium sp. TaxID=157278 RepID=UPI002597D0FC|nr:metallophosphoesterase [uncultured Methylobacterium sp.]
MRILLISDIHFESPKCLDRHSDPDWYYRNQLVNELGCRVADFGAFDAILIGGDIAFKGAADEYVEALRWIDELLASCGCERSQVFVIPGNHDIDRSRIRGSAAVRNAQKAILSSPEGYKHREFRDQWTSADTGRHLVEPLEAYNEFAKLFNCQIYAPDKLMWRQDIDLNDNVKLRIHGMTSALFCAAGVMQGKEERPGDLYLDRSQYVLAREPDVANLVFCHHPPNWFSDHREFEDAVNARAAIQVFGHEHRRRHFPLPGTIRFSCPAVTPPNGEQGWQPGYTVLELDVRGAGAERVLHVEAEIMVWQENPDCYRPVRMENGTERLVQNIPLPARRSAAPRQPTQLVPSTEATPRADDPVQAEAAMGNPNVRHLIERFWKLPGSIRREISLELHLIVTDEVSLPEPERYGRALLRAAERKQLNDLDAAMAAREAAHG